jgi:Uroporphyrinogen decarboxylase (URO-D)
VGRQRIVRRWGRFFDSWTSELATERERRGLWEQADNGAQVVQIFDSWASELAPQDFDVFAGPYIQRIIRSVRETHPGLQIILYISNSGGLMERMAACQPDIISVDQRVDMRDAIARIGPSFAVQVRTAPPTYRPACVPPWVHTALGTHRPGCTPPWVRTALGVCRPGCIAPWVCSARGVYRPGCVAP